MTSRIQRVALAALLAPTALSGAATAATTYNGYTRVGATNEYLSSDGRLSFVLQALPTNPQQMVSLPGVAPTNTVSQVEYATGSAAIGQARAYVQGTIHGTTGVFTGQFGGSTLSYYGIQGQTSYRPSFSPSTDGFMDGAGQNRTATYYRSGAWQGSGYIVNTFFEREPASVTAVWGSVESGNQLSISGSLGGETLGYKLTGADLIAAASELGLGGAGSSYRVTLNTVPSQMTLLNYSMQTSSGTSFELAPTAYGTTSTSPMVTGKALDSGAGALPQVPAPVIGSTPAGAVLSLSLLGLLGFAPRCRRAGASARA